MRRRPVRCGCCTAIGARGAGRKLRCWMKLAGGSIRLSVRALPLACSVTASRQKKGSEITRAKQRSLTYLDPLQFTSIDGCIERGAPDAEQLDRFLYRIRGLHQAQRTLIEAVRAAGDHSRQRRVR